MRIAATKNLLATLCMGTLLLFTIGCDMEVPLVSEVTIPIDEDLLGYWDVAEKEYYYEVTKKSSNEYTIRQRSYDSNSSDSLYTGYWIRFRDKKYLQVEQRFSRTSNYYLLSLIGHKSDGLRIQASHNKEWAKIQTTEALQNVFNHKGAKFVSVSQAERVTRSQIDRLELKRYAIDTIGFKMEETQWARVRPDSVSYFSLNTDGEYAEVIETDAGVTRYSGRWQQTITPEQQTLTISKSTKGTNRSEIRMVYSFEVKEGENGKTIMQLSSSNRSQGSSSWVYEKID